MSQRDFSLRIVEFGLQPLTPISITALTARDHWEFEEAVFILAGFYPPDWAGEIVACAYFSDDAEDSCPTVKFLQLADTPRTYPADCLSVAFLIYRSYWSTLPNPNRDLHRQKRGLDADAQAEPQSIIAPTDGERAEHLLFNSVLFRPNWQPPTDWLRWGHENLGDALPAVLKSFVKSETAKQRRERLTRMSKTMSFSKVAEIEGITRQRVGQLVNDSTKSTVKGAASPLRLNQLTPSGRKR